MSAIVVDQIKPQDILQKIGMYQMGYAESFKGEGRPGDDNFQQYNTSWRDESATDVQQIWLEMFRRDVARACHAGMNFCEFWGWPEVVCRDDGKSMVTSRIRFLRITLVHQPRPN